MTDDLDKLKRAVDAATPAPDPAKRAANLRLAENNFHRLQGTAGAARPTPKRARMARMSEGVGKMLNSWTTRGGLIGSTAIAAFAAVWFGGNFSQTTTVGRPAVVIDEVSSAGGVTEPEALADTNVDRELGYLSGGGEEWAQQRARGEAIPAPAPMLSEADAYIGTRIVPADPPIVAEQNTETFANAAANPVKVTAEEPVSTFSIDVDTASYSVVRQSLQTGALPPKDAVRVEEMINYFDYSYPAPDGTHPFEATVTVAETPWNAGTEIVHIGLQGITPAVADRPPLNLVFLIDTSGSMNDANKLPLLKQSFRLMLSELRPEDQVAIVTYAGSVGQVLDPTPAGERSTILAALDRLQAGGSTAGQMGLQQAYATAEAMADDGDVTRVILATDGDFNVGLSDPSALEDFIAEKKETGTYLSVLGFGRGNLDDTTMQALAQNGNGTAAYIDTLSEARKVLVDQLTGALFPIADDVKIQLEFNPSVVAEYRLIGYETRALAREDFNNDAVDAGEIGAGRQVTAIYEIARVGSEGVRNDPLRYGAEAQVSASVGELGFLKLRYKTPGEETSTLIETPISAAPASAVTGDVAFATAVAGFGQLLRGSDLLEGWTYADAIALANTAKGEDPFGYRAEALDLMRLAEALSR